MKLWNFNSFKTYGNHGNHPYISVLENYALETLKRENHVKFVSQYLQGRHTSLQQQEAHLQPVQVTISTRTNGSSVTRLS